VGGLEALAFDDDEFDVVFAANSVQYAADLGRALVELHRVCRTGGSIVVGLFGPAETVTYSPVVESLGPFMPAPPPGAARGGPFRLSGPGVLERHLASAGIEVIGTGQVNCPFSYGDWHSFWHSARAARPAQLAIGRAGIDAVETATRRAVEPFIAGDGRIAFDPNVLVYVVGRAWASSPMTGRPSAR
jgi:SAM-dependent methyltransferase